MRKNYGNKIRNLAFVRNCNYVKNERLIQEVAQAFYRLWGHERAL
jgi:hypothetical protein